MPRLLSVMVFVFSGGRRLSHKTASIVEQSRTAQEWPCEPFEGLGRALLYIEGLSCRKGAESGCSQVFENFRNIPLTGGFESVECAPTDSESSPKWPKQVFEVEREILKNFKINA
ncbi:hypothetical protein [Pseudomonas japonica]|uniref:hypothetical protein n=1 Tax=Pseudomonas japonica TaxID=256466 RepID=UPI003A867116